MKNKILATLIAVCMFLSVSVVGVVAYNFPEDITRFSNEFTITGTISIPDNMPTLTQPLTVWVRATTPTIDSTNRIITGVPASGSRPSQTITIPAGQTSATFELRVTGGSYIVSAQLSNGNAYILNSDTFYRTTGGSTNINHAATILNVNSNISGRNITLPRAERSISGRISLPAPATSNVSVSLFVNYWSENTGGEWFNANFTIPTGQQHFDYTIGVNARSGYTLDVSSVDFLGGSNALPISTLTANATNINATLREGQSMNVTVNLGAPAATAGRMAIIWQDADYSHVSSSRSINYNAGATQVSGTLIVDPDRVSEIIVGFVDTTEFSTWSSGAMLTYWHHAANGITSNRNAATRFSVATTSSVTITSPANMTTISGTVNMAGHIPNGANPVLVTAEFADGEAFGGYVFPQAGAVSVPFTIRVPQSRLGQTFNLTAARCEIWGGIISGTTGQSPELTLTNNMAGQSVSILNPQPQDMVTLSGTFTLPDYVDADNVTIQFILNHDWNNRAQFYIPRGTRVVNFTITVPAANASGTLSASITNPPANIMPSASTTVEEGQTTNINFGVNRARIISGIITLPNGAYLNSGSVRMNVSANVESPWNSWNTSVVLHPGMESVPFRILVPEGVGNEFFLSYSANEDWNSPSPTIPDTNLTLGFQYNYAGGRLSRNWSDRVPLIITGNELTGVDFDAAFARTIVRGTITLPQAALESNLDWASFTVMVHPHGSSNLSTHVSFNLSNGETSRDFAIFIPPYETATSYSISFSSFSQGFRTNQTFLTADGRLTEDPNQAGEFLFSDNRRHDFSPTFRMPTVVEVIEPGRYITNNVSLTMSNANWMSVDSLADAARFTLWLTKANPSESLDVDIVISQYSASGRHLYSRIVPLRNNDGSDVVNISSENLPALMEAGAYNTVTVWLADTMKPIIMVMR